MTGKNIHKETSFKARRDTHVCLFLVIVTLAVYWQVGNHSFVNYDDNLYVYENPYVQAGLTIENIMWAFIATYAKNWHPLTWLSHMLDCQLYGINPGWHHLTNVILHIVNTLLLFLVLRKMTGAFWQSGFVAALFALHPLHVESVAWVSERKDVLSTFFWMLTMWSYAWYVQRPGYVERPGNNRYYLVLLFFFMGLMAKPMLVTLPFVLLLLDYWPLNRFQHGQSGGISDSEQRWLALRLIWEKVPLLLLAAASSVMTFLAQQSGGALRSLNVVPLTVRVSNAIVSYVSYIGKMIWPRKLAVLYPHPGMLPGWQVAGACLLLVFISFLAVRNVRRYPYFAVGWFWYVGTLVPVIGLVQVGEQALADRYTYVPLIGLFIIIAWTVPDLLARWRYRNAGLATIAALLLLILMATTRSQVKYWANSTMLFEHALDVTADNHVAHNHLGLLLLKEGRVNEAFIRFSEAVRIKPEYAYAHNNLGLVLKEEGSLEKAICHFREALRINPNLVVAQKNLRKALEVREKID